MTDTLPGNHRRRKNGTPPHVAAIPVFKPYRRPPPRQTPSVRLARKVIGELRSQLGPDWHDRIAEATVTITISLDVAIIERVVWELTGNQK